MDAAASHTPGEAVIESSGAKQTTTRAVDRALQLLTAVLMGETKSTLTSLSRAVDLSPSTASRLLTTLSSHGFVQQREDGRYAPGPRVKQLAASALRDDPVYESVGVHLDSLAEHTHETASFAVPAGEDEVLYLRQVSPSTQQVQTIVWTGRTIPRASTALGSALDGSVNEHGYVVSKRPDSDVTAVATPIFDHRGVIIGAISINAPAYRTTSADVDGYGHLLVQHAEQLSTSLGAPTADLRADGYFGGPIVRRRANILDQ